MLRQKVVAEAKPKLQRRRGAKKGVYLVSEIGAWSGDCKQNPPYSTLHRSVSVEHKRAGRVGPKRLRREYLFKGLGPEQNRLESVLLTAKQTRVCFAETKYSILLLETDGTV